MLRSSLAFTIQADKVFTTVFKLDTVFLQRLVEPVLFVSTLVSECLTSSVQAEKIKIATTTFLDPWDLTTHMAGHFYL